MAQILTVYWNFLTCETHLTNSSNSLTNNSNLLTANVNFKLETFLWTLFFSFIYLSFNFFLNYYFNSFFSKLNPKKKNEMPSYALGLTHHFIIVPLAAYLIYSDFILPEDQRYLFDYVQAYSSLIPFTFGYFIADTIFYTFPEVIEGRYAYFIHHIFAVLLLSSIAYAGGPCTRAIPHFLLMELSTIFYGVAWILRQIGFRGSYFVILCEKCFVLFYFILRILHMPCILISLSDHVHTLGPFKYCLAGVMFLQFFWFYQIIRTLLVRDMGGKKDEGNNNKDNEKKKD